MRKLVSVIVGCLIFHSAFAQQLFRNELSLPAKGLSQRTTRLVAVKSNEKIVLFDETGPGCILHWWFTYYPRPDMKKEGQRGIDLPHELQLSVYYDDHSVPDIDMSLAHFFSILQGKDVYPVNNAAIKVLPVNALNCYFPMPFERCRIEIENLSAIEVKLLLMADWQEYPDTELTPYRLKALYKNESPAEHAGSMVLADITGEGFLAGMTKAVVSKDKSDSWYHTGGDLVLIDGESNPRAMRGIGGEDLFNMSFDIWEVQNDWVGTLVKNKDPYERGMYRIFGPCPIWFSESIVVRFGTKANDIETVIYAYVREKEPKKIITPHQWALAGPFECHTYPDFEKEEWADSPVEQWKKEHTADFGNYISTLNGFPQGPYTFKVPMVVGSEHGWCDFSSSYQGRRKTNSGTQPGNVSAYALSKLNVDKPGKYKLIIGYDDWMKIWINRELVYSGKHDHGFNLDSVEVDLRSTDNEIKVKLSNFDNFQWRLWAFTLRMEK